MLEAIDHYFYLGGEVAHVQKIGSEEVVIEQGSSSCLSSAFKVATYCTVIIPCLALILKACLRKTYHFHVISSGNSEVEGDFSEELLIPAEALLASGMEIDVEQIQAQIQELMPVIQAAGDDPRIEWLKKGSTSVFRLTAAPKFVVKMNLSRASTMIGGEILNGENQIRQRFANMVNAKTVCDTNGLNLIVIPRARMLEVSDRRGQTPVILEESLDILATDSAQMELHRAHADALDPALLQLVTFIALTGFNDVIWRNIPLLADHRIAIIDFKHMERAKQGLLGCSNGSCGLVRCLFTENQINQVLDSAQGAGILLEHEAQKIRSTRMAELAIENTRWSQYQALGIINNPRQPLNVNLEALGLNLEATYRVGILQSTGTEGSSKMIYQEITMREFATAVIEEINRLIQSNEDDGSVSGVRRFMIGNVNSQIRINENLEVSATIYISGESSSWLAQVLDALQQSEYITMKNRGGHGFLVQA